MSTGRLQQFMAVMVVALLMCATRAIADDSYGGLPLLQVRFDQLIPTSFPTKTSGFERLRQTTWPLVDPGVATVPITENLVHPLDQPLLIMTEGTGVQL